MTGDIRNQASRRTGAVRRNLAVGLVLLVTTTVACSKSDDTAKTSTKDGKNEAAITAAAEGEVATSAPKPSKGCGASKVGKVLLEKHTILDDRYYLLTTPKEHDGKTPLPLVLDIHGLLEGAEVHSKMSEMQVYGQAHGFVVVTPHGTGTPVHWEVAPDVKANPDLVYMQDVMDEVEADLCIDTSRVYATGLSNGAFMSSTLACSMADRITAIAPVSGVTFGKKDCKPSRHVPVLAFHGTADPILLFNGGVGDRLSRILSGDKSPEPPIPAADLDGKGYPETVRSWAKANGCKVADPTETKVTKTITQRTYDCPADGAVEFDIVDRGGHTWPGSPFSKTLVDIMGETDYSANANELIWDFFQRFALPQT